MNQDGLKICPFCNERIQVAAIKCRYCGEWLVQKPETVADQNDHKSPPDSGEFHVALAAESTPHQNNTTSVPETIEESTSQPPSITKVPWLTVKHLWMVSLALLGLSFAVMAFTLKDVNWSNPMAVQACVEMMLRILFLAGFIAAVFWSGSAKRKRYGFLTFCTACAILSFVAAHYFRVGAEKGRQHRQDLNSRVGADFNNFFQQVTNEGSVKPLAPTGDADTDQALRALQPIIEFVNDFKGALVRMEAEITEVNPFDVSSITLVTNKSAIESEIRKRIDTEAIIQRYQKDFPRMIDSARQKYGSLNISDDVKKAALRQFEDTLKVQLPTVDEMFSLRLRRQKADSDLLQFLLTEFNGYHATEEAIAFDLPTKQKEYLGLLQNIEIVMKDAEAFQHRQNEKMESAKGKIRQLTND